MEHIIMLILGVFISVVGIINIKGNISTIHSYNRRRVKEEDIPKYGKVVGTGTLIIGISLVLGFIVSFWSEEIMGYIILTAIIIGLGLILYGQFKYNKGIF
jgi:cadmium resistance protein CadD (predicted permease)